MKFLAVILLSLFISVKSSTVRRQDETFDANAKTNVKSSTAHTQGRIFYENVKTNVKSSTARTQDGIFHEIAKTNVNSSNAAQNGTFHKNAKTNGTTRASMDFSNDTKKEIQMTGLRKSVVKPNKPCYKKFFVGGIVPDGFSTGRNKNDISYICQKDGAVSSFSTMFDEHYGIPVYTAYVVKKNQAQKFGTASRAGLDFHPEPGISSKKQGNKDMYEDSNFGVPHAIKLHKGHLVPAETYSFSLEHLRSTFTFTNAVPQYARFNSGKWSRYEQRIRNYAQYTCSPQQGDLFLLTGISDVRIEIQGNPPKKEAVVPPGTPKRMPEKPYIVIPNSMWTAGCCVSGQKVLGSFAVIGNNDKVKANIRMTQTSVSNLEKEILGGIELFPGKTQCRAQTKDRLI